MDTLHKSQQLALHKYRECISRMPRDLAMRGKKLVKSFHKSGEDPMRMLSRLYAYMDELSRHFQRFTACQKGCSNCCSIPISVTELDVLFIEKSLLIRRNPQHLVILPETPCPFLVANSCSIYMHRPFVCRRNLTFDTSPKWCHVKKGANAPMPALDFSDMDRAYRYIVKVSGAHNVFDIRQMFSPRY